jgi:4-amino-4-deoxy-L-arabinose transferase-like glycosyltransferase
MNASAADVRARARIRLLAPVALTLFVFSSHLPFLKLPFYWDELGQFIPAALDIFQNGAWIPRSTVPNVHPPGLMAFLAAVWSITGYSIAVTRVAMLALGAAGTVITLRLGVRMGLSPGAAALAAAWLAISPLFFAQSMMAQLDMPAMVFFALALLLFLDERIRAAAIACTVLVFVKETGLVAPAVFFGWLWIERRRRDAVWFVLPVVPLLIWLIVLDRGTGHLFGNAAFTRYNLWYPLEPVRLSLTLLRRLYYLLLGSGHWMGTVAVIAALRKTDLFRARAWCVAGTLAGAHVLLVSALGGAVLERYLVPVLPVLYVGFAAAVWRQAIRWRIVSATALFAALVGANFVNPPYPFPLENNLAFTDFVALQTEAAAYLEGRFPEATIATMFPLSPALRRPEFGYVRRPLRIREIEDFSAANVAPLAPEHVAVFVLYSVTWDPLGLTQNRRWTAFLERYYEYSPPVGAGELREILGAHPVARWTRRGQWIEVYALP